MGLELAQKSLLEKLALFSSDAGTVAPQSSFVKNTFKSTDKILGQGSKALKPGSLSSISNKSLKNPTNAFTTTKGVTASTKGLGTIKLAQEKETPMQEESFIKTAYYGGVQEALEKLGMFGQAPMQQPPMAQAPMESVQQEMAPPLPEEQPQAQATPEEMQQIQNSGISSSDISAAAKVIQAVAEMKANADMIGMAPEEQQAVPAGQPAPTPAGGFPAPASMGVRG